MEKTLQNTPVTYKVKKRGDTVYFGIDWEGAHKYASENGGKVVMIMPKNRTVA